MAGIYRLKGAVKHYDWGGNSFIPSLLKQDNPSMLPFAEYWMGIHPLGHSLVETGDHEWKELREYTSSIPYLLKVLDVNSMLSVQVHPSREEAEKEFARENLAGIALDSPQRNYKDANHKPELIVALSDFWLLHGFKPQEELVYTLLNIVELRELLEVFNHSGYGGLYKYVMELPQDDVNRILRPLINNLDTIYNTDPPAKDDEDHWAGKAAQLFNKDGNIDRGIFSIYLFNLVHLKKGEGIFQDAGVPHAYLEGKGIEIMANSDNVLRGGLTNKHIDVVELLKHTRCEAHTVHIIKGAQLNPDERSYSTPVPDFSLSVFELKKNNVVLFTPVITEILLLTEGMVELSNEGSRLELRPGQPSAVLLPGEPIQLKAGADATVFRASVPVHQG